MSTISKSRFLSGCQCEKKLFYDINRKDLKPPVSEIQQAIFDTGHLMGKLAQRVFPDGIDATEGMNGNWTIAINRTKKWISEGIKTIYEATFSVNGAFAALDILHKENGELWAIEVKSSNSLKPYHITDASFQYHVMKQAGLAPNRFFLMHLDKAYVKNGVIEPKALFHLEEITIQVLENQPYVQQKHGTLLQMLKTNIEPDREIGKHCSDPFVCDYMNHCWGHLPENNVFNLYNSRGKDWALYDKGIQSLLDIPADFPLNDLQTLQVRGAKFKEDYVDIGKIGDFLKPLKEPLYFLDFETINPALPVVNGTSPFEQVPFQYSLYVTDLEGNILRNADFIANPLDFSDTVLVDPRLQFIQTLKRDIGNIGTVIAYNAVFEKSILTSLSNTFEAEKEFLESLSVRFLDLLVPFRAGWYYKSEMKGSASIKSVLPAIAPEFSYGDLKIKDGGMSSHTFFSLINNSHIGGRQSAIEDLLKYCQLDTKGMVVIYQHLKRLTLGSSIY